MDGYQWVFPNVSLAIQLGTYLVGASGSNVVDGCSCKAGFNGKISRGCSGLNRRMVHCNVAFIRDCGLENVNFPKDGPIFSGLCNYTSWGKFFAMGMIHEASSLEVWKD